ncbi:MAG TPA: hypothetical protein VM240_13455 [Verrucomicrobiae bacterium]|nr:hypothetical protein [Verrucomicrobiae bacterium]
MTTLALLLAGCASTPLDIKHVVLTAPPSKPSTEFRIDAPEMASREVGRAAWTRNDALGHALAQELRAALADKGKKVDSGSANAVRAKVYLAFGASPVATRDKRRAKAHVEVRLQWVDARGGQVLYTTHTLVPLPATGDPAEAEPLIREVFAASARDFASRL